MKLLNIVLVVAGLAAVAGLARSEYVRGERAAAIAADHAAERTAVAVRAQRVDTVRVLVHVTDTLRPHVAAMHDTVRVADSTHLVIQVARQLPSGLDAVMDSIVTIPSAVTRRFAIDSIAFEGEHAARLSLEQLVDADSNVIHAQAKTNADLEARRRPRLGLKTGLAIGAAIGAGVVRPDLAIKAVRLLWRVIRP